MLSDCVRMDSYSNAVFENKHHFEGKAVLDVGKGSRILAIWSAQAGARKVYAVDATKMVEHASELVKAISVQDIFEVIEGSMEDVTLPEKGSHENRAPQEIELTTAPNEDFGTHWGQQVFLLHPPVRAHQEDNLILNFSLTRSKENHRLMEVDLTSEIKQSSGMVLPLSTNKFYLE